jgi:hypothetical protein
VIKVGVGDRHVDVLVATCHGADPADLVGEDGRVADQAIPACGHEDRVGGPELALEDESSTVQSFDAEGGHLVFRASSRPAARR